MKKPVKRVIAIHDLCGFGRAALMNIIPILSYQGIEVCPVPTMILSSHTGGFDNIAIQKTSNFMKENLNHWADINFYPDCIYTGYLGGIEETKITKDFIKKLKKKNTLVVIDTVFADNNKLYKNMNIDIVNEMKEMISLSDIITPNYTEACFLAGIEPVKNPSESYIFDLVNKLKILNIKKCIVTSVPDGDEIKTIYFEKKDKEFKYIKNKKYDISFAGTGDIFTSVLVGNLLNNLDFDNSIKKSLNFVLSCITTSMQYDYDKKEGILLEKCLHLL